MPIDFKDFRQTLTYTATASIEHIVQDLDTIAELDREAERKKHKFTVLLIIGLSGVFVSFFLVGAFSHAGIIFLIGFGIATIVSGIFRSQYDREDIPNYRYELSRKVLSMLNRDVKENTNININLIFTPPVQTNKQVSAGNHPSRRGWKVQLFQDKWCSIEGEFNDRNRFQLSLTEFHQIASGSNSRGKYKSKTKSKGTEISLKLNCNQRQYGAMKILKQDAQGAIKLPERVMMKELALKDKAILLKVQVPPEISNNQETMYQAITMMFLSLYQILNLARMLSKK